MSKKLLLKFKSSRSLSENLWPTQKITLKQKGILSKLKIRGKRKLSPFGLKKQARRALFSLYGNFSSNQYKIIREEAGKLQGKIGNNFISLLEKRLDSTVFRMNICPTFRSAKQLILHQKILINNKIVNRPSYQVEPGDIISVSPRNPKFFQSLVKRISQLLKEHRICKTKSLHLEINYKTLQAIYLYPPQQLFHSYPLDLNLLTKE